MLFLPVLQSADFSKYAGGQKCWHKTAFEEIRCRHYFYFYCTEEKTAMVMRKLHLRQKQPDYTAYRTLQPSAQTAC